MAGAGHVQAGVTGSTQSPPPPPPPSRWQPPRVWEGGPEPRAHVSLCVCAGVYMCV